MPDPTPSAHQHPHGTVEDEPSVFKSLFSLKVVGGTAAVLSLFLTLNQFTGLIQKFRIHHADFNQTMKMGDQQMQRQEYQKAFDSFKHAMELDPIDRNAQLQEVQAGMMWLENAHSAQMSFKNTADAVQPVLERALTGAQGEYAGDLAAHIGWANFLRLREGDPGNLAIESLYKQAFALDPGNAYAHAMLGHWILQNHGSLNEAREHFSAALASGKHRDYVRALQIAALLNVQNADDELLRVVDQMRRGREQLSADNRERVFDELFNQNLHSNKEPAGYLTVVNADELAADYDWLVQNSVADADPDLRKWRKAYLLGVQAEAKGDKKQALARYQALQAELRQERRTYPNRAIDDMVNEAIKRMR